MTISSSLSLCSFASFSSFENVSSVEAPHTRSTQELIEIPLKSHPTDSEPLHSSFSLNLSHLNNFSSFCSSAGCSCHLFSASPSQVLLNLPGPSLVALLSPSGAICMTNRSFYSIFQLFSSFSLPLFGRSIEKFFVDPLTQTSLDFSQLQTQVKASKQCSKCKIVSFVSCLSLSNSESFNTRSFSSSPMICHLLALPNQRNPSRINYWFICSNDYSTGFPSLI